MHRESRNLHRESRTPQRESRNLHRESRKLESSTLTTLRSPLGSVYLPCELTSPLFLMTARQTPKPTPTLRLKNILPAVGSLIRWRMLAELAKGEPLPASELAKRGRISLNAASKHLVLLHEAGLLDRG